MGMTLATRETLRFSNDNKKLDKINDWYVPRFGRMARVYSLSLPSGWTCPFAKDCLSKADRETGRITDGIEAHFRCFAASMESHNPAYRKKVWDNLTLIRKMGYEELVETIHASIEELPRSTNLMRQHVGGEFFNERYFRASMKVASMFPDILFYAYTKSLPYWIDNADLVPDNYSLIASRGGRYDELIDIHGLKCAEVVFTEEEAAEKGLEIDYKEELAIIGKESFALLAHGVQPKGFWKKVREESYV
jgi:hypothetical protein